MNRGAVRALLIAAVLSIGLPHVPYARVVVRPLVWLSTLAHELGHGFTAIALGGSMRGFQLHPDGSGVASWSGNLGAIGTALVAAGGLVGPAIAAACCFVLTRSARGSRFALGLSAAGLAFVMLVYANNLFTWGYLTMLVALFGVLAWRASDEVARQVMAFLGVQLAVTVFSRSDYLFSKVAQTASGIMPSDTAQMAHALWLPAWFWGAVCGLTSLVVLAGGVWVAARE